MCIIGRVFYGTKTPMLSITTEPEYRWLGKVKSACILAFATERGVFDAMISNFSLTKLGRTPSPAVAVILPVVKWYSTSALCILT